MTTESENINVDNNVNQRPQNKHLVHWPKGVSGNPAGRTKGQRDYLTVYKEALKKLANLNNKTPEELEDELVASGFARAKKDYRFYKDFMDRLHGMPVQTINQSVTELPTPIAPVPKPTDKKEDDIQDHNSL